jgi:hypothetical protein
VTHWNRNKKAKPCPALGFFIASSVSVLTLVALSLVEHRQPKLFVAAHRSPMDKIQEGTPSPFLVKSWQRFRK